MRKLIRQNLAFFIPFVIFIILCIPLLLLYSKAEIHIYMNRFHCLGCDYFFKYLTFLGNGWFVLIVVITLLFYQFRLSLIVASSTVFSGFFVQFLKRIVFEDTLRPVKYFENIHDLHLVNAFHNYSYFSFPSGHTASAFSLFLILALASPNKGLKFLFFLIAILIGYSRVYLSQHFLIDVYFGSIIGVLFSIPIFYFITKKSSGYLENSLLSKKIS